MVLILIAVLSAVGYGLGTRLSNFAQNWSKYSTVLRSAGSETSYSHTAEAHEGLMGVSIDEVISAAQKLLESETIPAGGAG